MLFACDIVSPYFTLLFPPGNGIGVAGFRHLADGVSQNSVLEYLDLARNGGRDPGVEYLSEALRENTSIRRLNLRGTEHVVPFFPLC